MARTVDRASKVREIYLSLPDTKETPTWGSPHFRVGEKIFGGLGEHEDGSTSIGFKLEMEHADALVGSDPRFTRAKYVGHKGWVDVDVSAVAGQGAFCLCGKVSGRSTELRETTRRTWLRAKDCPQLRHVEAYVLRLEESRSVPSRTGGERGPSHKAVPAHLCRTGRRRLDAGGGLRARVRLNKSRAPARLSSADRFGRSALLPQPAGDGDQHAEAFSTSASAD